MVYYSTGISTHLKGVGTPLELDDYTAEVFLKKGYITRESNNSTKSGNAKVEKEVEVKIEEEERVPDLSAFEMLAEKQTKKVEVKPQRGRKPIKRN